MALNCKELIKLFILDLTRFIDVYIVKVVKDTRRAARRCKGKKDEKKKIHVEAVEGVKRD